MDIYRLVIFLHVIGVFGFLMAHGISAGVYFALRHKRNADHLRLLLQMSSGSARVMLISLLLSIVTGAITGFMGQWWSRGWIWLSLILLVALYAAMDVLGPRQLNKICQGIGLPSSYGRASQSEPLSAKELNALLDHIQRTRLALIG